MDPVISYLDFQIKRALFIIAVAVLISAGVYSYLNPHVSVSLFGALAGILTSIRFLPQVYLSWTTRDTRSISLLFLIITFSQAYFLILYGTTKPDYLIAVMNILPFLCTGILTYWKLREGRERGFVIPLVPPGI